MERTGYVRRLTKLGLALSLLCVAILTSCRTESKLASFCGNGAKIMVLKDKLSNYWVLSGGGAEKLGGKKIRVLANTKVTRGKGEGDPELIAKALIDMYRTQSGSWQMTGTEITNGPSQTTATEGENAPRSSQTEESHHAKVYDCTTGSLKETTVIEVAEILAVQDKK